MTDFRERAESKELRRQAERRLDQMIERSVPKHTPENVMALIHELQVHQIELEMQCHELRRTQEELEESRDTYRELYESIPVGYVTLDRDGRLYDINPMGMVLLKWTSRPHKPRIFNALLSDKDRDRFSLFCRGVVSGQVADTGEFEMKRPDGSVFFAALQAAPVKTGKGKGELIRVAFQDITSRKEAEEQLRRQQTELEANRTELRELTRKLLTVQDEERAHLARELHDDYCQRVTALVLETNMLKKACERDACHLVPRLTALSQRLSDMLAGFRTLSHELLPPHLGGTSPAVPIRNLAKEISGKAGFEITVLERDVPPDIPPGTMTTLFRLLQECLCNIVKHANAKHVTLTLAGTHKEVELIVADDGLGFDPTRAWNGQKGIGIVGMRERVRLVGGTVKITSEPGRGTTVVFSIPLSG